MNWKEIKKQAILKELDKLLPGERKNLIENRYCNKCWNTYASCECEKEDYLYEE